MAAFVSHIWTHEADESEAESSLPGLLERAAQAAQVQDLDTLAPCQEVADLLQAAACPPIDGLRATTAPETFAQEERSYERWRHSTGRALEAMVDLENSVVQVGFLKAL